MHASVLMSMPFFDGRLEPRAEIRLGANTADYQERATDEAMRSPGPGEGSLSIGKLHERLSLLAQLELPCTIILLNPHLLLPHAVIKKVELGGECLSIDGENFKLHLRGTNIHSIRLVNHGDLENGLSSVDIQNSAGTLFASIRANAEGTGKEVWRDIMENPSLSFA